MSRHIVSIHDVMPDTLSRVDRIIEELAEAGWPPATLLVVPGRDWDAGSLARLRYYVDHGHALAGHGWLHKVPRIRNLGHRLHSLLISRRAAEHYVLDALGVETLVRRCRYWFVRNGLPAPELYVPPAWALGPASAERIAATGYRYVETLTGIYDSQTGRLHRLPVLGFEADTAFRAWFLRRFNAWNIRQSWRTGAVRLAIHPYDLELKLANDLRAIIRSAPETTELRDLRTVLAPA